MSYILQHPSERIGETSESVYRLNRINHWANGKTIDLTIATELGGRTPASGDWLVAELAPGETISFKDSTQTISFNNPGTERALHGIRWTSVNTISPLGTNSDSLYKGPFSPTTTYAVNSMVLDNDVLYSANDIIPASATLPRNNLGTTGATWLKVTESPNLAWVFAPVSGATGVTVAVVSSPTVDEIKAWAAAQTPAVRNRHVYYTGTITNTDTPTYIWWIDGNGVPKTLDAPKASVKLTRTEFVFRTNATQNVAPTGTEFANPGHQDAAIVVLNDGRKEYYVFVTSAWVRRGSIAAITADGGNFLASRQNAIANVSPTATEVPSPKSGDTTSVYLNNGNIEQWFFNGTAWSLIHTVTPATLDGNTVFIVRSSVTEGAAPTNLEVSAPVRGDTAIVFLNNTVREYWSYGTTWTLVKTDGILPPSSQHDAGLTTTIPISTISGVQAHLEGGVGYLIAANTLPDNWEGTLLNKTEDPQVSPFSGFAGAYLMDGTGTLLTSPLVVPAYSEYRLEVVINGINRFLHVIPQGGGGGGSSTPPSIQSVNATGDITEWNSTVLIGTTAPTANMVLTVPTAAGNIGKEIKFIRLDNTAFTVTLAAQSGETLTTLNGAGELNKQNSALTVQATTASTARQISNIGSISDTWLIPEVTAIASSMSTIAPDGRTVARWLLSSNQRSIIVRQEAATTAGALFTNINTILTASTLTTRTALTLRSTVGAATTDHIATSTVAIVPGWYVISFSGTKTIVQILGGIGVPSIQAINATGDITAWNSTVLIGGTAPTANMTLTLPTTAGNVGQEIKLIRLDSTAFTVTLATQPGETLTLANNGAELTKINGALTVQAMTATTIRQNANIGTTPVIAGWMHVRFSNDGSGVNNQTTQSTAGHHVQFDSITSQSGNYISLDTTTPYVTTDNVASRGRFTLQPNISYRLIGQIVIIGGFYLGFAWFNVDTGTRIGTNGGTVGQSNTDPNTQNGPSIAYITPTVATRVELRVTGTNSSTQGLYSGNINIPGTYAEILAIAGHLPISGSSVILTERALTGSVTGKAYDGMTTTHQISLTAGTQLATVAPTANVSITDARTGRVAITPSGSDVAVTHTVTTWRRTLSATNATGGAVVNLNGAASLTIDATLPVTCFVTMADRSCLTNVTATNATVNSFDAAGRVMLTPDNAGDVALTVTFSTMGSSSQLVGQIGCDGGRTETGAVKTNAQYVAEGKLPLVGGYTLTGGATANPRVAQMWPELVSGANLLVPTTWAGIFLRNQGTSGGSNEYASGTLRAIQDDATARNGMGLRIDTNRSGADWADANTWLNDGGNTWQANADGWDLTNQTAIGSTDNETRPVNMAVRYFIYLDSFILGYAAPTATTVFIQRNITGAGITTTIGRDNTVSTIRVTGITAGSEILQAGVSATGGAIVSVVETGRNGTAILDVIPNGADTAITITQSVWRRTITAVNSVGGAAVNVNNAASALIDATRQISVSVTVPGNSQVQTVTATNAIVLSQNGNGFVELAPSNAGDIVLTVTFTAGLAVSRFPLWTANTAVVADEIRRTDVAGVVVYLRRLAAGTTEAFANDVELNRWQYIGQSSIPLWSQYTIYMAGMKARTATGLLLERITSGGSSEFLDAFELTFWRIITNISNAASPWVANTILLSGTRFTDPATGAIFRTATTQTTGTTWNNTEALRYTLETRGHTVDTTPGVAYRTGTTLVWCRTISGTTPNSTADSSVTTIATGARVVSWNGYYVTNTSRRFSMPGASSGSAGHGGLFWWDGNDLRQYNATGDSRHQNATYYAEVFYTF